MFLRAGSGITKQGMTAMCVTKLMKIDIKKPEMVYKCKCLQLWTGEINEGTTSSLQS